MNMFFFIKSRSARRMTVALLICQLIMPSGVIWAGGQQPLHKVPVPLPADAVLSLYVKDKTAAIALGKALFWDMQAGSDGKTACATCHYKAGADPLDVRSRNQLHPGPNNTFDLTGSGPASTLTPADFPFFQVNPPTSRLRIDPITGLPQDPLSTITRTFNDVAGSQGVHKTTFTGITPGNPIENGTPVSDPTFSVQGQNVRQVTGRNSPSVVNAVFNYTNFWDGRGNNIFNGVNPFGPLDQNARIWRNTGTLVQEQVAIPNASLASQAVGPPLNDVEMSYAGRTFPELGRKMLSLTRPLNLQLVHGSDSVLGGLSRDPSNGLTQSYTQMIQAAFQNDLWDSGNQVSITTRGVPVLYDQIEANFSLFWGISIMLYEATLISDWTPFDRFQGGNLNALGISADAGLTTFDSKCAVCHSGAELTDAVVGTSTAVIPNCALRACNPVSFTTNTNHNLIQIDQTLVLGGLSDAGFSNLGLRPMADDPGRASTTPPDLLNGLTGQPFPLSFSLLAQLQAQQPPLLPFETPSLTTPSLLNQINLASASSPSAVRGTFKTPGIRNVELTAPYFHNGSMDTLQQIVEFYARGGNFPNVADNPTMDAKMDPIGGLRIQGGVEQADMRSFLMSLTDERVRNDQAPFDHPELIIPNGDPAEIDTIALAATGGTPAPVTIPTFTINTLPTGTTSVNVVIGGEVMDDSKINGVTPANNVVNVEVDVNGVKSWATINRLPSIAWKFTATPLTGLRIGHNTISATASTPTGSAITLVSTPTPTGMVLFPTAIVLGAPLGATKQNVATISVAAANSVSSYRYSFDGSSYSTGTIPVADPIVLSGLSEGVHTLAVIGTAMVGTVPFEQPEANATTAIWRVKTIPPVLTVDAVPSPAGGAAQTITGTVELGITPVVQTDTGASAAVTVTGDVWSCRLTGLKKGVNNITVRATDIAQNVTTVATSMQVILPDGCFRGSQTPDVTDAVKALRIAVGLVSPSAEDMMHGDVAPLVDGTPAPDGSLGVEDALAILKKVVGLVDF